MRAQETTASPPPGVVIDHQPAATKQYIGSPSIVILPNGDYVATHDLFGKGSDYHISAKTRVFRSHNRGSTWTQLCVFDGAFWSNLFLHRGKLYLMGTDYEYGHILIRSSSDGGSTWTGPTFITKETGYHTAPVPMAEYKGRLWRAFEIHPEGEWGHFRALMLSIPLKGDLMKAENWKLEQPIDFPESAEDGWTWLEGNAIVGRDGKLYDVLRVDNAEQAAIVEYRDGALHFNEIVPFPGGAKKFTIRWDAKSKLFWTLSNPALPQFPASAKNPASVRNTLALMSSPDLHTWTIRSIVLSHPDVKKHAFQYVDWQFDGNDLIVASRTAWEDAEGQANTAHNANFLIFHRVNNFRQLHTADTAVPMH
ncbi:MAG: exo-alpha-sialidase [Acidobacteria bacterium]|nr:exo-alpha-sialidase [Acidobacteriota bacterium]